MAEIPPWLNIGPKDFVEAGAEGARAGMQASQLGSQAGLQLVQMRQRSQEATARLDQEAELERERLAHQDFLQQQRLNFEGAKLQQESELARMQLEVRKEQNEMQAQRLAAQDELTHAYKQAALGLQAARLKDAETLAAQKREQAAQDFAATRSFLESLKNNTPAEAWRLNPGTPTRVAAAAMGDWRGTQALNVRADHYLAMEDIAADKANALLRRGEATVVTHPEAPGVLFLRQPSGAEVRISSMRKNERVVYNPTTGEVKSVSGDLNSPTMQQIMGKNAPKPPPEEAERPSIWKRMFGGSKTASTNAPAPTAESEIPVGNDENGPEGAPEEEKWKSTSITTKDEANAAYQAAINAVKELKRLRVPDFDDKKSIIRERLLLKLQEGGFFMPEGGREFDDL